MANNAPPPMQQNHMQQNPEQQPTDLNSNKQNQGEEPPVQPNTKIKQQLPEGDAGQIRPMAKGYENVGFEGASVAPPNQIVIDVQEIIKQGGKQIDILQEYAEDAILSEEAIREIVLAWVRTQGKCWGKKFAKKMEIKSVTPIPALRYEISSYCEDRKTQWKIIPFMGGLIDGPQNGIPPGAWAIPIHSTGLFRQETYFREIPHTCSIHPCFRCHTSGELMCKKCGGDGEYFCVWCGGMGFTATGDGFLGGIRTCYGCYGRGAVRCHNCKGSGSVPCYECDGYGNLKTFVELTVAFHSVTNNWLYDRTGLPKEDLAVAKGKRIMEQVLPRLSPIQGYKLYELNKASYDLVMQHSNLQQTQRVHYQGHNVEAIPVTQVIVFHGKKREELVILIYGFERNVVFPDYPQKGCC